MAMPGDEAAGSRDFCPKTPGDKVTWMAARTFKDLWTGLGLRSPGSRAHMGSPGTGQRHRGLICGCPSLSGTEEELKTSLLSLGFITTITAEATLWRAISTDLGIASLLKTLPLAPP